MTPPLARRTLIGIGTAVASTALLPSTVRAESVHAPFGAYGAPGRRLSGDTVYVDPGGRGDYRCVRDAVDGSRPGTTVVIAAGEYHEHVRLEHRRITLIGASDDPLDVVIAADSTGPGGPSNEPDGPDAPATITVVGSEFTAHGITFEHHRGRRGASAAAAWVRGDRAAFYRCRFLGSGATLGADSDPTAGPSRQYYRYCRIDGEGDLAVGRATAVFDRCELRFAESAGTESAGAVFTPATAAVTDHGFLAVACRVTADTDDGRHHLARPWIADDHTLPALTIRDSWIGPGVDPAAPYEDAEGDHCWRDQRFFEHADLGPGAEVVDPDARPPQLTEEEAVRHTAGVYLGDWAPQDEPDLEAPRPRSCTVYVAGDSTASAASRDYKPAAGWGQALPVFTADQIEVDNRAWSGRSSMSYAAEGSLDELADDLRPGDWLLISFGHNDQKRDDPERGTDPWGTYQGYLRTFLEVARLHRANPVLVSSVERRRFDEDGDAEESLGEYPAAMAALADEEGVPLVDLHTTSLALWDELGEEATKDYFCWIEPGHPNYPDGNGDNTHFQATGAIAVARLVAVEADASELLPRGGWTGLDREVDPDRLEWPETVPPPPD